MASRDCCLVVVHGLLTAVASLVAELGLESIRASVVAGPGLEITGSVVMEHGLSCPVLYGIFLDQGSNWSMSLVLAGGFFTTELPGKPYFSFKPPSL